MGEAGKLAFTLLGLIAESLGLPRGAFDEHFAAGGASCFRLNHYPPCPAPHLALGVGRHKDSGALTVLLQDHVGGLQVKTRSGAWIDVKPDDRTLVVNVGDVIQVPYLITHLFFLGFNLRTYLVFSCRQSGHVSSTLEFVRGTYQL
jgi:isopenicillin N synthase-like dioxygenase